MDIRFFQTELFPLNEMTDEHTCGELEDQLENEGKQ